METIEAVLLEPVGCLAEFPAEPFLEIAVQLFGRKQVSQSGSRCYWHVLNLMESANRELEAGEKARVEALETQAAAAAEIYEDVLPALAELKTMGIRLLLATSLSEAAVARFLERCPVRHFFTGVSTRNHAGSIKTAPLERALAGASLRPDRTLFLTDTAEGMKVAKQVGTNAVLMMNDPDESRRLAHHEPAGGIVSLHELPDFLRLVAAKNSRPNS